MSQSIRDSSSMTRGHKKTDSTEIGPSSSFISLSASSRASTEVEQALSIPQASFTTETISTSPVGEVNPLKRSPHPFPNLPRLEIINARHVVYHPPPPPIIVSPRESHGDSDDSNPDIQEIIDFPYSLDFMFDDEDSNDPKKAAAETADRLYLGRMRLDGILALYIRDLELTFLSHVVEWALRCAPAKPICGLIDFSHAEFAKLQDHYESHMQDANDISALEERIRAMKMWAMGEGVKVRMMRVEESGGLERIRMFAKSLFCEGTGSSLDRELLQRRRVWRRVVLITTGRLADYLAASQTTWIRNLTINVANKWIWQVEARDFNVQEAFVGELLKSNKF